MKSLAPLLLAACLAVPAGAQELPQAMEPPPPRPPAEAPAAAALPPDEAACRDRLRRLGVAFAEAEPIEGPQGCAAAHPLAVTRLSGSVALEPPAVLTCAMAEAAAGFVRPRRPARAQGIRRLALGRRAGVGLRLPPAPRHAKAFRARLRQRARRQRADARRRHPHRGARPRSGTGAAPRAAARRAAQGRLRPLRHRARPRLRRRPCRPLPLRHGRAPHPVLPVDRFTETVCLLAFAQFRTQNRFALLLDLLWRHSDAASVNAGAQPSFTVAG